MSGKCLGSGHALEPGPSDGIHTHLTGVITDIIYRYFQVMTRAYQSNQTISHSDYRSVAKLSDPVL